MFLRSFVSGLENRPGSFYSAISRKGAAATTAVTSTPCKSHKSTIPSVGWQNQGVPALRSRLCGGAFDLLLCTAGWSGAVWCALAARSVTWTSLALRLCCHGLPPSLSNLDFDALALSIRSHFACAQASTLAIIRGMIADSCLSVIVLTQLCYAALRPVDPFLQIAIGFAGSATLEMHRTSLHAPNKGGCCLVPPGARYKNHADICELLLHADANPQVTSNHRGMLAPPSSISQQEHTWQSVPQQQVHDVRS